MYPGYNFGGPQRPPFQQNPIMGQLPPMGGGQQQMQPLGQQGQLPQYGGLGGQQQMQPLGQQMGGQQQMQPMLGQNMMQPLGMGQMPTNGGAQNGYSQGGFGRFAPMLPQLMGALGGGGAFGRFGPMIGNEYGALRGRMFQR